MTTATERRARVVPCDDCGPAVSDMHDERYLISEGENNGCECLCHKEPCYQCGGSGEAPDVSPAGVVNWGYLVDCGACDGTGAERE